VRRVLAIDGGGIKGVLPAAFLATIEQATGERIVDHFDLIAGTSTGGIIALGLGMGLPASEILRFYRENGPSVFGQPEGLLKRCLRLARWPFRPKYDADALRSELAQIFGDRKLGESETRLVIPAYHRDQQAVYVFKTAHHRRLEMDYRASVVDVALATAAAPVFFPAHRLPSGSHLIDGGIWANNPVGLAAVEAVGILGWPGDELRVLSLGCSDEAWIFGCDPGVAGMGILGRNVISLMFQGQSHAALGTAKILTGHPHNGSKVWRYSPTVPIGTFVMDNTGQIERLAGLGEAEAREALPELRRTFLTDHRAPFAPEHSLA
jgi:patatin-like phospholipase/acyl hydrolase